MQTDHITTFTTEIKASPEEVWKGITDPEMVKQYFFGTDLECTWQEGQPIRFSGEFDGRAYEDKGIILQCTPLLSVSYSYLSSWSGKEDVPENYLKVSYLLEKSENGTKLIIRQSNYSEELAEHSNGNWKNVIDGLKALIEPQS